MDEDQEPLEPKITLTEALYIGCLLVLVSIVNLIPFVGDFTSVIAGGLMFYYLYSKDLLETSVVASNAVGYGIGFFPILQALPTELAAWIATVVIVWNPKLKAAAEIAGKAEGGGALAGAASGEAVAGGAKAMEKGAATGGTKAAATEGATRGGAATAAETGASAPGESGTGESGGSAAKEARTGSRGEGAIGEAEAAGGLGEAPEEAAPKEEVAPEELGEEPELLGEKGRLRKEL